MTLPETPARRDGDAGVPANDAGAPSADVQTSYAVALSTALQENVTGEVTVTPSRGATSAAGVVPQVGCVIVAAALALLFAAFGSGVDEVIAVVPLSELPVCGALTEIVIVAIEPLVSVGALHVTFALFVQVNVAVAELAATKDTGAVSAVFTATLEASPGPLFVTVTVKVTAPPGATGDGAAVIVTPRSAERALIGTEAVPVAVHVFSVAVACNATVPLLPAVKVTTLVDCPPVIEPF